MKHRYTKYGLLGMILVFLILNSCQNDDFKQRDHNHHNKINVKIEEKTLDELMNDQKFSTAFGKIPKQQLPNAVAAKTVMEQDYDFIISDNIPAKIITTENLISYTFHISRENDSIEDSNSFENLIVLTDSLDTTTAYILKYNLLSEPVYLNEHDSYVINAETELTPITFNASNAKAISFVANDGCTVVTLMCPYQHPHPAGAGCVAEDRGDLYWESDSSNCGDGGFSGSGGSGGTGSAPGNQNGGGANNNGNNNTVSPVVTTPVGVDGRSQDNNCLDLKEKMLDEDYKDKLEELKEKAGSQNVESAYVTYSEEPKFSQEFQGNENIENGSMIEFQLDTSRNDQTGFIHCHLDDPTKKNFAVFSLSDLVAFAQIIQNSTAPVSSYTLVVTSAKGTFALKITNKNKFIAMTNALINDWWIVIPPFEDVYVKTNESANDQITGFLMFFAKNTNPLIKNAGFEFFSCDSNFDNWTKHELDNNNVKKTKKC